MEGDLQDFAVGESVVVKLLRINQKERKLSFSALDEDTEGQPVVNADLKPRVATFLFISLAFVSRLPC